MQAVATFLILLAVATPVASQTPPSVTPGELLVFKPGNAAARAVLSPVTSVADMVKEEFAVALVDLDGDGRQEIVVQVAGRGCDRFGCMTMVLQQLGRRTATLGGLQARLRLAASNEKIGSYRALTQIDEQGRIALGDRPGWPKYREPLVH